MYSRVVWRSLEARRDKYFLKAMDNFIKVKNFLNKNQENHKKKYELSIEKLMREESKFPTEAGEKKTYENFFCSQLVAAAYKTLGYLPKKIATSKYWPVNFSQEKNLELIGNATLGPEKLINFDL